MDGADERVVIRNSSKSNPFNQGSSSKQAGSKKGKDMESELILCVVGTGAPIVIVHRKRKFNEISNDNSNMVNHSVMIASSRPLADCTN